MIWIKQSWHESLEAHFGKFRVFVNGCDIRGWYRRCDAEQDAESYPPQYHSRVVVPGERHPDMFPHEQANVTAFPNKYYP